MNDIVICLKRFMTYSNCKSGIEENKRKNMARFECTVYSALKSLLSLHCCFILMFSLIIIIYYYYSNKQKKNLYVYLFTSKGENYIKSLGTLEKSFRKQI